MKKWTLIVAGALVVLILAVQVFGTTIPVDHVATSRAVFAQSPEAVYDAVADHANGTAWRTGLSKVERLDDRNGRAVWREETEFGPMTIRVDVAQRPSLYVTTIADEELPFGGSWTYTFEPVGEGADAGCLLTIKEEGFVKPAIFRFLSRYVFGYNATKDRYMHDLGRKFGEEITPEHVEAGG